jgi:tyrosine-protein kinase Etk/Wzc
MIDQREWADEEEPAQPKAPSPFRFTDAMLFLRQRSRRMLAFSLVVAVLAAAVAFSMKDTYTSTAVILPPRQDTSLSALLSGSAPGVSSLGASAALGGLSASFKNPNDMYVSLLSSRTLTAALVERYNLKSYYKTATTTAAIRALHKHTTIESGTDDLIRITVQTQDPNFSSQLANAFVDGLHTMNTSLALTESAQRRLFFEGQLDRQKAQLAQAEDDLEMTQKRTGVLMPAGQAELQARNITALQSEITNNEAALQSVSIFATSENIQYRELQAKLSSLRGRLAQLQNSQHSQIPGNTDVSAADLPSSSLEYARKYREVELQQQLYATLQKQVEAARLDEAKSAPVIQVVDRAVPAERRSGPNRGLIIVGAAVVALLLNVLYSLARYAWLVLLKEQSAVMESSLT